jgi:hypothetical protein
VFNSHAIAQMDAMLVARTSAVRVVLAAGKECCENAMLHVKHRQMLVQRQFEPRGRCGTEQVEHLFDIQVAAHGDAFETLRPEKFGAQRIGNVEGKVAHFAQGRILAEMGDRAEVPDEHAVWRGVLNQPEKTLLARLLNARGGEKDGSLTTFANERHGFPVAADVLEIDIHLAHSRSECRCQLIHGAAEHVK